MSQGATQVSVSAPARCAWVDVVRVLAILLVGMCHQYYVATHMKLDPLVTGGLCAFFFLAGYFFKSGFVHAALARNCSLLCCFVFWCTVNLLVQEHFNLGEIGWKGWLSALLHGGGVYWFLRSLLCVSIAAMVFVRMCPIARWAIVAVCFYYSVEMSLSSPNPLCQHLPVSLFLFVAGVQAQAVPLPQLGWCLMPAGQRMQKYVMCLALSLFVAWIIAIVTGLSLTNGVPWFLLALFAAWLLMAVAYSIEQFFPKVAQLATVAGPTVVMFYVLHHLLIRAYTSFWVHNLGGFPPLWFDLLFLLLLMIACAMALPLRGKNRIIDTIFFAR